MYKHTSKIWCRRCNIYIDEFNYEILDEVVEFHCPGCGDDTLLRMMPVDDYFELQKRRRSQAV